MTSERIEPCPTELEIARRAYIEETGYSGPDDERDHTLAVAVAKRAVRLARISRPSSAPSEEMVEAGRVAYSHFRQTIERDVLFCDLTSEEQEELATRIYDAMNRAAINVISGERP